MVEKVVVILVVVGAAVGLGVSLYKQHRSGMCGECGDCPMRKECGKRGKMEGCNKEEIAKG